MNNISIEPGKNDSRISFPQVSTKSRTIQPIDLKAVDRVELSEATIEKPSRMLLELLRTSLKDNKADQSVFQGATREDWSKVIQLAERASVSGFAFDGVSKLEKGTVPPNVVFDMFDFIRAAESKYAKQEAAVGELSATLSKKGIDTIVLKGLGLSLNYPHPTHRHGCDIDIFTRLKDTVTEGRSNATKILDDMMAKDGVEVEEYGNAKAKHSKFKYNGLTIENHRFFVNKYNMKSAGLVDKLLHEKLNPVEKVLPNGTKILVPSNEFNTIFLAQHAFQHFVFGGIDLHNLVDWSMHIDKNGLTVPKELKGTQLEKFMYALTNVSNKYLGTDVKVPEDKEFEQKVINKIVSLKENNPPKGINNFELLLFKTKRFLHNYKETKPYTEKSIFSTIAKSIKHKIHHPETVFRRL